MSFVWMPGKGQMEHRSRRFPPSCLDAGKRFQSLLVQSRRRHDAPRHVWVLDGQIPALGPIYTITGERPALIMEQVVRSPFEASALLMKLRHHRTPSQR